MTGKLPTSLAFFDSSWKANRSILRARVAPVALSVALLTPFALGAIPVHAQATGGGQSAPPGGGAPPAGPGSPTTTPGSPSGGTTSPSYQVEVDDVLDVQLIDHPEVNRNYTVPAEGIIDIPLVGELNVLGLTLRDLKKTLATKYSKEFYHPDIILSATPAQMTVDVVGVTKNGKYPLKHNEHVLEVIATAGGLPVDRPENYKATLIRGKNGDAVPIDLKKLYDHDPAENLVVFKDDTLYIEEKATASISVQVIGQVLRPGQYTYPRDGSILTVVQEAGGSTPIAALSEAKIKRGEQMIPIDLRDYLKTGFVPSETLQAGDELIIPENKNVYFILGAGVSGPKVYPDDKKLTVFSAYNYASASTEGVDLKKVVLLHPVPGGKDQTYVIDLQKMYKTGDLSGDRPIVPNDSIFVPPSSKPRGIQATEILGILGSLAGLASLYYIFK